MAVAATERFPCTPTSPAIARRFCTTTLARLLGTRGGARSLIGDAEMIVSELVTNAVNARGTAAELTITASGAGVRIEVRDDAGGTPQQREPGLEAPGGRGLMIVAALSDSWGVRSARSGKTVWAEVSVHRAHAC